MSSHPTSKAPSINPTFSANVPSTKNVSSTATITARTYYNSSDADTFYHAVWGGSDIHVGIYPSFPAACSIASASQNTVAHLASLINPLTPTTRVLDMGAGYGGAARYLARTCGCKVTCLNLSEVENERNRAMTREHGLQDLVEVVDGAFEEVPVADHGFDVVWSQDAFLHSGDRGAVVSEIDRVLVKKGGRVVFTDPMAAEGAEAEKLAPILKRLHLESLGSVGFYKREFEKRGFRDVGFEDLTEQMVVHYSRVLEELEGREEELKSKISDEYVRNMKVGLGHWIDGRRGGQLCWGVLQFRR